MLSIPVISMACFGNARRRIKILQKPFLNAGTVGPNRLEERIGDLSENERPLHDKISRYSVRNALIGSRRE
jgi:hypothetical protein